MKRIHVLDEDISNKIAAGEVVERPASVVKELIENSIDAEAKNIIIEVNNDNDDQKIKISDDGIGIHYDDIEKAFLPHGTSKILKIDDLHSINTFGFRGEALPSISAVSKVSLKSRSKDNEYGREIYISGGNVEYIKDVGCSIGTSIEVSNLFFNVPARKKFLKSKQRETSLISNIVNRLALANYDVSFKYYINGKKSLITFPSKDVKDTIRSVYGKNIYNNIIGFEKHSDIASIYGYIGSSEISRGSRNNQSIFVNKRYIKSALITSAVENAFKSFLTINKFPFFVLFLEIYPELVDVNVHPAKAEVKFQEEKLIYKLVFEGVHEALAKFMKNSFEITDNHVSISNEEDNSIVQLPIDLKEKNIFTSYPSKREEVELNNLFLENSNTNNDVKYENMYGNDRVLEDNKYTINDAVKNNKSTKTNEPKFPYLNIIGQFNNTYILAQESNNFYIIDQHAAHEKILFEKFKNQIENSEVISQILITPIIVELSSYDYVYYTENMEIFNRSGFFIEDFGDNTISIREAPMLLGKASVEEFFLEILDNLKNMGSGKTTEVNYNIIASLACKAAIKANHPLTSKEMNALIEELRYIKEPFNCPHGRPTIVKISLTDIEKMFKRIQ
ncbi:DNA mismatch repair endonuclease MutL [Clostridium thermopalmarium]|uniref:DNA mismatch repair protein MutL n=1 Tax=Clostridium thermopalmarium DSM 5974 TaxID=1121340 RepID=A0A2T0AWY1_9CLOT|nr:DNA mismatch repair endonuclease MutL [Clostridium thermopalmarium]MBE6042687.1 DNA mismatch repair endonuclease MutL [Clostridium thermopalmarium]MBE6079012.1 DNA mismatch repair endonuclease MutL [Clostridium lundense]PRR75239.1 DNA mismatch repair protein MutL [Clostridium thermopalmarium DSM 5974]PVZ27995.1 DNA mismatch repair protein MutL [Clostridium thermopalmarium DSM 5974]